MVMPRNAVAFIIIHTQISKRETAKIILLSLVSIIVGELFFQEHYPSGNSLDPDQDRHSVDPDLGTNCLQRLSADDKSCCKQGKSEAYLYKLWQNWVTTSPWSSSDERLFLKNKHTLQLGKKNWIVSQAIFFKTDAAGRV